MTIEVTGAGSLAAGSDVQLTAIAKNATGAAMTGISFTWQSSATGVATVSTTGLLHGVSAGAVTVTARADGKSGTLPVEVRDNAALPQTLTGKIERVDLTIAANQTFQVTGNTALVVDSTFILAGTLEIAKGASLTLYGGKLLRITGILDGDSAAEYVIGGGAIEIVGDPSSALRAPPSAAVQVKGQVGGSGPTYLGSKSVTVKDGGSIVAGKGTDGTRENRAGGKGHNVEIGTLLARSKVNANTSRPGPAVEAIVVENGGKIHGGEGGSGFDVKSRADGEPSGNTWIARAGAGGAGGDVFLSADRIDLQRVFPGGGTEVRAGFGGRGGVVQPDEFVRSGTGPAEEGESMNAFTGSGGPGGNLSATSPQFTSALFAIERARGGGGGGLFVSGGSGLNSGAGGTFVIVVGTPGQTGEVTVPAGAQFGQGSSPERPNVSLSLAINGGRSFNPQRPGGPGGVLVVSGPGDTPANVSKITLSGGVGLGGKGFDGCSAEPVTNGTNGGPGGERTLRLIVAPFVGRVVEENGLSFSGGDGGPGWQQAGAGGLRGDQIEGPGGAMPIGVDGNPGEKCPPEPLAMHRTAIANPDVGVAVVTGNGTLQAGPTLVLPGAVSLAGFQNDPSTIAIGTATSPAVITATVGETGLITVLNTHPVTSPVFGLATVLDCIQAVQPGKVLFFNKQGNLINESSVPNITNVLAGTGLVYAHAGNDILIFEVNPVSCAGSPSAAPPLTFPNLRDFDVGPEGNFLIALGRPLAGPGTLSFQELLGGIPTGAATVINLATRPFDVEINPAGTRAHMMGDLGEVTWAEIRTGVPRVTVELLDKFTLPGADRFKTVQEATDRVRMIYLKVSNPSLGQVCSVLLGEDGFPAEAPVCEQNSTRPRPDSDLEVLPPIPAGLRTSPAQVRARRAPF